MASWIKKLPRFPCHILPDYRLYIITALSILTIYAALTGFGMIVIYQVLIAMVVGGVLDYSIIRFRSKNPYSPTGAVISSMIIAQLINPGDILLTVIVVVLMLILKHIFRPKFRNIFNPAAFSVSVATMLPFLFVFSSWWASAGLITFILGALLVILIKRWPNTLVFLLTYWMLDKGNIFLKTGAFSLNLTMLEGPLIYFACFMLIEPVTTSKTYRGMAIFGIATGILAFIGSFSPYLFGNSFHIYFSLMLMNLLMRFTPRYILE